MSILKIKTKNNKKSICLFGIKIFSYKQKRKFKLGDYIEWLYNFTEKHPEFLEIHIKDKLKIQRYLPIICLNFMTFQKMMMLMEKALLSGQMLPRVNHNLPSIFNQKFRTMLDFII